MQYETPGSYRYIYKHVYGDRHDLNDLPPWLQWFDPVNATPLSINESFIRPVLPDPKDTEADHDYEFNKTLKIYQLPDEVPPDGVYCLTVRCINCKGTGYKLDAQGNPVLDDEGNPVVCSSCLACDNDRNGHTDVRVFIQDLYDVDERQPPTLKDPHRQWLRNPNYITDGKEGLDQEGYDFIDARIYRGGYSLPTPFAPLVLAEEFFAYGVNAGAWRDADTPMLFRYVGNMRQRVRDGASVPGWSWGYIGIASARVGIPKTDGGFRYHFETKKERADWCADHPNNLYAANVHARLYPCKDQVKGYDLDREILDGETGNLDDDGNFVAGDIDESGTSYLWDAVLHSRGWLTEYDGRSDPRVNELLRSMRTRADGETIYGDIFYFERHGANFDFGSAEIDEVVLH